jgi:choline dehydrogenase
VTGGFDVVVVGGGAAGCVVAARLAERGSQSVLLLEAGPDRRLGLPGDMRNGWQITRQFDWGYTSEPDAHGSVEDVRRNKLLGGTSWVTRFTPRGSPADYDQWAARGNPGWGFDDVLPSFKRLETDTDFGDRPWHGDAGPIPSTRYLDVDHTEAAAATLEALEAAGFPTVDDHNRPGAVGAGRMPMNSLNGIRVTTADAYLPVDSTPANLHIRANAHVADVVFDGLRARGVRLVDGTVVQAGWVVLCAGTFGSPAILMRSGIGPADHLRSIGVPIRVDLHGVGANLSDHPGVDVECDYHGTARGAPILHLMATFHSSKSSSDEPPDLMLWVSDPVGDPPGFEIDVVLLKPRSRGSVRLGSADPAEQPAIKLPNLNDAADVDRLAEGYRVAHEVAEHPELRRICGGALLPRPGADAELREHIRASAYSIPHLVGTCAMGPRPDDGAVVDASGRVHGAEALTIADASIMPEVPSGFTHIPTIMIAEALSERLKSPV